MRNTKIITTIGPATENEASIKQLIDSGANVCRFNLKHNTSEWHRERMALVKKIAEESQKNVAVLVDIPSVEKAELITESDFTALSYLRNHQELIALREVLDKVNPKSKIIAKIENRDAIDDLDMITDNCDGVMVARGDLGIEVPIEQLAFWQKKIIEVCRKKSIPVIVATQMLQSMTKNPTPTRAEATDVANAIYDGADALMLSEETAIGEYPRESVEAMAKIIEYNEGVAEYKEVARGLESPSEMIIESAASIIRNPKSMIRAAVVFSQSGKTVRMLSSYRCNVPIIAVTNNKDILSMLNLSYGVIPLFHEFSDDKFMIDDPMFDKVKGMIGVEETCNALVVHGSNWISSGSTSDISLKSI